MENKSIIKMSLFFLVMIASILLLYQMTHEDCIKNPPQTMICDSSNILEEGYSDCILVKKEDKPIFIENLFREGHNSIYNCFYNGERIEVEYKETNCHYATSNLTRDYQFCKEENEQKYSQQIK